MLTLSFATQYYTLWDVTSYIRYGRGEVINGVFTGESYLVTNYCYLQNLSFTKEAAIEKITAMAGGPDKWEENESLKGKTRSWEASKKIERNFAPWQFTFGLYIGTDIRTCEDAWQIRRAYYKEPSARTRACARRRLIDLGELVKCTWEEPFFDNKLYYRLCDEAMKKHGVSYISDLSQEVMEEISKTCNVMRRRNYTTPKHAAMLESKRQEALLSGHFSEDGKRLELGIKELRSFSFESRFGTTHVVTYITAKGNIVKYMGGNPPEISKEEFTRVKATIKHSEYKGVKETHLQRIKVLLINQ